MAISGARKKCQEAFSVSMWKSAQSHDWWRSVKGLGPPSSTCHGEMKLPVPETCTGSPRGAELAKAICQPHRPTFIPNVLQSFAAHNKCHQAIQFQGCRGRRARATDVAMRGFRGVVHYTPYSGPLPQLELYRNLLLLSWIESGQWQRKLV